MIRKRFWLIAALLLAMLFFIMPKIASAHRDGCHRWHSCPSDNGSYVCGDTGHYDYCPQAPAPTPTLSPLPTLAPTPTPVSSNALVSSNAPSTSTGEVSATSLNVRAGPGTNYQVISALTKGTSVTILEQQPGWLRLSLPGNANAWVSADYVTNIQSSTTAPSALAVSAPITTNVAPVLISPINGQSVNDPPVFTWSWSKTLASDEGFDVQVWKDNQPPAGIAHPSFVIKQSNGTYTLQAASLPYPKGAVYSWRVRVINTKSGAEVVPTSQAATFRYE